MTFDEFKTDALKRIIDLLGDEYNNQENIDFLMPCEDTLEKDYMEEISYGQVNARNYVLLLWCGENLQYQEGKDIFLIRNNQLKSNEQPSL